MSREVHESGLIPKRWLHCPRRASDLLENKFLAFKVPLGPEFNGQVPPDCRFPPSMLLESCKNKKINLGLWIDLTNTNRFYNKKEVENADCKYVKLPCRGHKEAPSTEQTQLFIKIVDNFIAQNPLRKIGIHCTHGFNRTGFLVISYLVEKMDYSLDAALEDFAKVRSPGIYKAQYIKELYRRYDTVQDAPTAPTLPDWCFEEEESEFNSSASEAPLTTSISNGTKAQFMAGVSGVTHFTDQPRASELQKQVQKMCKWKRKDFPGSQPVSMTRDNLNFLAEKPYMVSWKADGMRYMLLIDGPDEVYFFDRDYNVFKVKGIKFPQRKNLNLHVAQTLLDGEMVIDKVNNEEIPRYLAYDIITFQGKYIGETEFSPVRLDYIHHEIIMPRYSAIEHGIINKTAEPFSIRKKDFWEITQARNLLGEKFAKNLSHEPDGLIFQPKKEPYVPGRCDSVLKWKPPDMNSIDFRMKIVQKSSLGMIPKKECHLFVGQCDKPFATMNYTKALNDYNGKILECTYANNQWVFMRERTDKSFPNSLTTAEAVFGSILKPVYKEYLLEFIDKRRFRLDSDMMAPPQKMARR